MCQNKREKSINSRDAKCKQILGPRGSVWVNCRYVYYRDDDEQGKHESILYIYV